MSAEATTPVTIPEGQTTATEAVTPTPAATKHRMNAEDVLHLQSTINPNIKELIQKFLDKYPRYSEATTILLEIIDFIDNTDPQSQPPSINIAPQPQRVILYDTADQIPISTPTPIKPTDIATPNSPPLRRDASKLNPIPIEKLTRTPREKMELLMEKVFGLITMMENALNNIDEEPYLSMGSIKNVGMSLFRRVFYVANMEAIINQFHTETYPYIEVDDTLLEIMRSVFLKMFFSPLRHYLVPYYIHAAVLLCTHGNIRYRRYPNHPNPLYDLQQEQQLPVRMNRLHPCNKDVRIFPLHIISIRKNVNDLAAQFIRK